jgi:hypothetical protein
MDVILAFLAFVVATLCACGLVMMLPPSGAAAHGGSHGAGGHGGGHGASATGHH